jgi:hypothetical protein
MRHCQTAHTLSVMVRVAQIIIWAVILVLAVRAHWTYLELAPMD